jgi:hypothetical protein
MDVAKTQRSTLQTRAFNFEEPETDNFNSNDIERICKGVFKFFDKNRNLNNGNEKEHKINFLASLKSLASHFEGSSNKVVRKSMQKILDVISNIRREGDPNLPYREKGYLDYNKAELIRQNNIQNVSFYEQGFRNVPRMLKYFEADGLSAIQNFDIRGLAGIVTDCDKLSPYIQNKDVTFICDHGTSLSEYRDSFYRKKKELLPYEEEERNKLIGF